jgi:cytidine deaminase
MSVRIEPPATVFSNNALAIQKASFGSDKTYSIDEKGHLALMPSTSDVSNERVWGVFQEAMLSPFQKKNEDYQRRINSLSPTRFGEKQEREKLQLKMESNQAIIDAIKLDCSLFLHSDETKPTLPLTEGIVSFIRPWGEKKLASIYQMPHHDGKKWSTDSIAFEVISKGLKETGLTPEILYTFIQDASITPKSLKDIRKETDYSGSELFRMVQGNVIVPEQLGQYKNLKALIERTVTKLLSDSTLSSEDKELLVSAARTKPEVLYSLVKKASSNPDLLYEIDKREPITPTVMNELVRMAQIARTRFYAPHSHFPVGAAILSTDGEVFIGCNTENAAYGSTICAERNALSSFTIYNNKGTIIQSSSIHGKIAGLALVLLGGGSPCGACRQSLREFNQKMPVIMANCGGTITKVMSLEKLLKSSFGPEDLHV